MVIACPSDPVSSATVAVSMLVALIKTSDSPRVAAGFERVFFDKL
jgi:hypothetical protein